MGSYYDGFESRQLLMMKSEDVHRDVPPASRRRRRRLLPSGRPPARGAVNRVGLLLGQHPAATIVISLGMKIRVVPKEIFIPQDGCPGGGFTARFSYRGRAISKVNVPVHLRYVLSPRNPAGWDRFTPGQEAHPSQTLAADTGRYCSALGVRGGVVVCRRERTAVTRVTRARVRIIGSLSSRPVYR